MSKAALLSHAGKKYVAFDVEASVAVPQNSGNSISLKAGLRVTFDCDALATKATLLNDDRKMVCGGKGLEGRSV
jgi:hypothetical protein